VAQQLFAELALGRENGTNGSGHFNHPCVPGAWRHSRRGHDRC
jgi:hypothetical protein